METKSGRDSNVPGVVNFKLPNKYRGAIYASGGVVYEREGVFFWYSLKNPPSGETGMGPAVPAEKPPVPTATRRYCVQCYVQKNGETGFFFPVC